MLKGIWLQTKFCDIFLGDVKINALKGGGGASKYEMIILFSRCQIVKATGGYHN